MKANVLTIFCNVMKRVLPCAPCDSPADFAAAVEDTSSAHESLPEQLFPAVPEHEPQRRRTRWPRDGPSSSTRDDAPGLGSGVGFRAHIDGDVTRPAADGPDKDDRLPRRAWRERLAAGHNDTSATGARTTAPPDHVCARLRASSSPRPPACSPPTHSPKLLTRADPPIVLYEEGDCWLVFSNEVVTVGFNSNP